MFFEFWAEQNNLIQALIKSNQKALLVNKFHKLYTEKLMFIRDRLGIEPAHWPYFVALRSSMLTEGLFEWIKRGKKESPEEVSKIILLSFSELHQRLLFL